MPTPVTDPELLAQLNGVGPRPVSDPAILAQLEGKNPNAIGNPWEETKRAFNENLDAVKRVYTDYQPGDQFGHLGRVGSAIAAVPGMMAAPVTGAARSIIGGGFEAIDPLSEDERKRFNLPDARQASDLAMMGVAPRSHSPVGPRMTKVPTPGVEDLYAASDSAYKNPAVTNLRISPQGADDFVTAARRDMLNQKIDPIAAPTVDKLLENLKQPRFGPAHTVDDFDLARKSLKDVPYNEGRGAGAARRAIDNYLGNIPAKDVVAGDAKLANEILLDARGNHAAAKRTEQIVNALTRADNQTGSTFSGGNINNATRQQLRPILNEKQGVSLKKKVFEDYTPAEIEQIKKAVNGTVTGNVSRLAEKELKKLPVPFVGRALGWPARLIADASTKRQGSKLAELLASRSPLAQSLPPVPAPRPNPVASGVAAPTQMSQLIAALLGYRPRLVPANAEQDQQ